MFDFLAGLLGLTPKKDQSQEPMTDPRKLYKGLRVELYGGSSNERDRTRLA